jgi:hypothetical protein
MKFESPDLGGMKERKDLKPRFSISSSMLEALHRRGEDIMSTEERNLVLRYLHSLYPEHNQDVETELEPFTEEDRVELEAIIDRVTETIKLEKDAEEAERQRAEKEAEAALREQAEKNSKEHEPALTD